MIVVCCTKLLMLRPPLVKSLRLSGERFFCLVLVLLRKNIVFLEFPHHLHVLKKIRYCIREVS